MSGFRMYRARGQPGCWYGYAEIDGITYKIDARHVGKGKDKHFEGSVKRHLKADQRSLPGLEARVARNTLGTLTNIESSGPPEFDDSLDNL